MGFLGRLWGRRVDCTLAAGPSLAKPQAAKGYGILRSYLTAWAGVSLS